MKNLLRSKTIIYSILIALIAISTSCKKNDTPESNILVGSEWLSDDGAWLLDFESPNIVKSIYYIPAMHGNVTVRSRYSINGKDLLLQDLAQDSPHGKILVYKDFKGHLNDGVITCDFTTASFENNGFLKGAVEQKHLILHKQ